MSKGEGRTISLTALGWWYTDPDPTRHRPPLLTTAERHERMLALQAEGLKAREIADAFGLAKNTVYGHLRGACRCSRLSGDGGGRHD